MEFGELKQGKMCLDTLSHHAGQGIGMFECHGMGGNQVSHHGNFIDCVTMVMLLYYHGNVTMVVVPCYQVMLPCIFSSMCI